MTLSNKLIADYVEMINEALDKIPITKNEEFELTAQELQHLITPPISARKDCVFALFNCFFKTPPNENLPLLPTRSNSNLSREAQSQIEYVRYYLENPREFVALKQHYVPYQEILKKRIAAKIIELKSFNEEEKERYILFQEEQRPEKWEEIDLSSF